MKEKNEIMDFSSTPLEPELDESYWEQYEKTDCKIPFGGMGTMRMTIKWIAQYSTFYHEGKWPNTTQSEYNQFYNGFWEDIKNTKLDAKAVFYKYFDFDMTIDLFEKIAETIQIMKVYSN
jgi:hypothetical protein